MGNSYLFGHSVYAFSDFLPNFNILERRKGVKGMLRKKKYFFICFSWCINMDVYMYISVLLCWIRNEIDFKILSTIHGSRHFDSISKPSIM